MKRLFSLFISVLLICVMAVPATAEETVPQDLVTDNAGILTSTEYNDVVVNINRISNKYDLPLLIYTTNDLDTSPSVYAEARLDEYLDATGQEDGLLLLVAMNTRDVYITATGYASEAFTDYGKDIILDKIVSKLSDGDYHKAFIQYVNLCRQFLRQAKEGSPYDTNHKYQGTFDIVKKIVISAFVSIIVTLIIMMGLKSQLTSVKPQKTADSYIKQGSFNVTNKKDLFLYSNVTKTRRSSGSGSGGGGRGSSTHRSAGGRMHSGRGRKF